LTAREKDVNSCDPRLILIEEHRLWYEFEALSGAPVLTDATEGFFMRRFVSVSDGFRNTGDYCRARTKLSEPAISELSSEIAEVLQQADNGSVYLPASAKRSQTCSQAR
jgi:hypothetical protein